MPYVRGDPWLRRLSRCLAGQAGLAPDCPPPPHYRAVSGGSDGTVRVWDLEAGTLVHALPGHQGQVCTVAVSADGRRAVTGGLRDGTVPVWDTAPTWNSPLSQPTAPSLPSPAHRPRTRVIAGSGAGPVHLLELCEYEQPLDA